MSAAWRPVRPRGYVCYRATEPLVIDGRLDKPAWKDAPWTEAFKDIEGDIRPRPRFRTRAKMLWDDNYLYVGAQLEEPNVWGTLTKHDSVIYHDNDFEVFMDPDGDNHQYYELEINALNTTWDLRLVKPYRDGGPPLDEWEIPGLKTAVFVDGTINNPGDTDRGWSVEFAFPWKALAEYANRPAPPHPGDQWRINFSRVEWDVDVVDGRTVKVPNRPEHNWVWSPQGYIDMHRPETWGYVQFSGAKPGTEASRRDTFRRDPCEPARMFLMSIYHAQRAFRDAHGDWATTLSALGLRAPSAAWCEGPVDLRVNGEEYEASLSCRTPSGAVVRWHVREDSRLWADPR